MISAYVVAFIMLLLSAFFSGIEIAFVSANRLIVELKNIQGSFSGRVVSRFVKNSSKFITSVLVGNNLALVIYGIFIAKIIDPWLDQLLHSGFSVSLAELEAGQYRYLKLLVQTLISTMIILVFGEYLPKAIFRNNPNQSIQRSAPVLAFFYGLFYIPVSIIHGLSRLFLKNVFNVEYKAKEEEIVFGRKDLQYLVQEAASGDTVAEEESEIDAEMFTNALDFNTIKAKDCMVPRTEIESIVVTERISSVLDLFIKTEHSKIIIYRSNLDEVVGYVHSSSMLKNPKTIAQVIQPVLFVPETMPANMVLREFTQKRRSVAIVVDEFGGTAGLITIEDLVEEVFGEIEDEHDIPEEEQLIEEQVNETTWRFSARLEVDEVNKTHDLSLPIGEYTTLSGMVMHYAEDIPAAGTSLDVEEYIVTILEATETKIELLEISKSPD